MNKISNENHSRLYHSIQSQIYTQLSKHVSRFPIESLVYYNTYIPISNQVQFQVRNQLLIHLNEN